MPPGSNRETCGLLFASCAALAGLLLVARLTPAADPLAAALPGPLRSLAHAARPATPAADAGLEEALSSVHRLRTRITYELDGEPARSEVEGTGFVVEVDGRRWVASLAHAVSDESNASAADLALRPASAWRARSRLVSRRTWIDLPGGEVELRPVLLDAASDLAFFEAPTGAALRPLALPAAGPGALRVGDPVFLLGRLEGTDLHVRSGIVSATAPTPRVAELPGARDAFMISAPLSHGDSGAPVLAKRAGRLELAGIAQGKYATAREAGWVIRIGPALAALRRAAAGAGVAAAGL